MIRKYQDSDLNFVQKNDLLASLEIQYHKDVDKDNIYTVTGNDGEIKGVLYFRYHYTWELETAERNRIVFNIVESEAGESVKEEMIEHAKKWCQNMKIECSAKKVCLSTWIDDTDYTALQFYLSHGFTEELPCPCHKFDLEQNIPEYPVLDGMRIEQLPFEPESVNKFIEASKEANGGVPDSINELWFMSGDDSYKIFVLMDGNRIVSSASIWRINEERSAIENIFTTSAYRNHNMARCIIAYALRQQKEMGYKTATLSMRGNNKKALQLYQSLGFKLYYNQIELRYE